MFNIFNISLSIIIRTFFLNICILYVYIKSINIKTNIKTNIIATVSSVFMVVFYVVLKNYINIVFSTFITYFIYHIILKTITKTNTDTSIINTLTSWAISNIAYGISILLIGPVLFLIYPNYEYSLYYFIYGIVQILLVFLLFKIKKFKNGFEFLQKPNLIKNIRGYVFILIINVVFILDLSSQYRYIDKNLLTYLLIELMIIGVIIAFWIWKEFISFHKETMKERFIENQNKKINELELDVEKLAKQNDDFSKIIHKYRHGFVSMESSIKNFSKKINLSTNTEFATEYADILDNIKTMSKNFSNEVLQSKSKNKNMPSTNIFKIDSVLGYMYEECTKNNIKFDLKLSGSIHFMLDNVISCEDLAILLSDHIKNAIIAVNSHNNTSPNILVLLGIVEDYYQLWIYDSGIPFELKTLASLGVARVTTHKNNGGSGIGFITSFEIFEKTNASLIIEELAPSSNDYTKIIKIKFDGKKDYKISSYRCDEIKEFIKDERIIVEKSNI